jgi:hypothetical protein
MFWFFRDIVNHKPLSEIDITISLHVLSVFLKKYYEKRCFVFIDEYDTSYDISYRHGYYEDAKDIMSQLLLVLLKVLLSHT